MKVLHLTAGNLFGGVETYLITLAKLRHLCPEMEPQYALCFPGRLHDELTATGVPVHDMGKVRVSRPWTVLRARWRLKRLMRQTKFDAVVAHSSWPHAVFAPVVRKFGVRLVHALHGETNPKHWLNRWATRTSPDVVIANSHFIAEQTKALFPNIGTDTVYLPVESPAVNKEDARQAIRAELGTPLQATVILQVSRLEEWKGQTVHIAALGQLREVPGWEAWFAGGAQRAGEAEFLDTLRTMAQELGIADRVRFLGQRSDVSKVMAAADIFCQPNSGPEPFGIVFVEALYAGLPVITTAFGGAVEIVTPECGVLCAFNDAAAVAGALRELVEQPARCCGLGSGGPARAALLCDPSQQVRELRDRVQTPTWRAPT